MNLRVNDDVVTLLGPGVVQGQAEDGRILVRIQITDENRKHLADANCWSPRATVSGVWAFGEDEVFPAGSPPAQMRKSAALRVPPDGSVPSQSRGTKRKRARR